MDVNTAFLQTPLEDKFPTYFKFHTLPAGYRKKMTKDIQRNRVQPTDQLVAKLMNGETGIRLDRLIQKGKLYAKALKSVYGLCQADADFYHLTKRKLVHFGLQRSQVDHCYFWFYSAGQWARVLIYVDDVFYSSNSTQWRYKFEKYFQSHFDSDKMGIVSQALGAQIKRGPNLELSINLTKFITNFCEEVFTRT